MQEEDEKYMQRCLQLARLGESTVAPNPMVGAVLVHRGKIIGEGWHHHAGAPHAEVNAIAAVRQPELLPESTLYVNLEPCAHFGRTPPCAMLITEKKIPRVVIGCRDDFSAVNGAGIAHLRKHGVEVTEAVLEVESQHLNRRFLGFHRQKRPYITLKWAQSRDGFLEPPRAAGTVGPQWITAPHTRLWVHRLRSSYQALLVGRRTVENDDPGLGVTEIKGPQPLRMIIDPQGKTNPRARVFRDAHFRLYSQSDSARARQQVLPSGEAFLPALLAEAYTEGIQSILVEGGAHTLSQFIAQDLWDEALVLTGALSLGKGLPAPRLNRRPQHSRTLGPDLIQNYFRQ